MPVYEFYCVDCHRLFRFLSRRVDTRRRPPCPRCGRARLERRPSTFAVARGASTEPQDDAPVATDEARLETAMQSLASRAEAVDADDPREGARLLRSLYETAGLRPGAGMEEALRRIESGEDPDRIEEQLGDALEEDPLAQSAGPTAGAARRDESTPPSVDPELHEL